VSRAPDQGPGSLEQSARPPGRPSPVTPVLDIISHSEGQTQRYGAHLGELLQAGDVVLLHGTLGAGKTTFARGVALGLGVRTRLTSPTFTLINEYREGRLPLYHIDFYRLNSEEEALALGIEDYLYGDGVCLIEWAEKLPGILPDEHLAVTLTIIAETKRRVVMEARGLRYASLLREFRRRTFGV
jgi:tRNA threonylcarbamoyladenosine biosynthesis protein TsaE